MCEDKCNCHGSCDCHCDESNQQGCGCCDQHHFQRRYQTKAEQIVELEACLMELKTEVQAVEERLADLRK